MVGDADGEDEEDEDEVEDGEELGFMVDDDCVEYEDAEDGDGVDTAAAGSGAAAGTGEEATAALTEDSSAAGSSNRNGSRAFDSAQARQQAIAKRSEKVVGPIWFPVPLSAMHESTAAKSAWSGLSEADCEAAMQVLRYEAIRIAPASVTSQGLADAKLALEAERLREEAERRF